MRQLRSPGRRPSWPFTLNWASRLAHGLIHWVPMMPAGGLLRNGVNSYAWDFAGSNMLTASAGSGAWVGEPLGGAIGFKPNADGDTIFQSVKNSALTGNPDFSIAVWLYMPTTATFSTGSGWATFVHIGTRGANGSDISFGVNGTDETKIAVGTKGTAQYSTGSPTNQWNHYVWTRDSGGGTNDMITGNTLYVNGVSVGLTSTGTGTPNVVAGKLEIIGGTTDAGFLGTANWTLAEARVYNRTLTGDDVRLLYDPRTRWDLYSVLEVDRVPFLVGYDGTDLWQPTDLAVSTRAVGADAIELASTTGGGVTLVGTQVEVTPKS